MTFATLLQNLAIPLQWWVVIAPWERGIRIRGGKNARELPPGFHFKIPFVDRVYVVGVRMRMIADTGQTMRTKDGHAITVNIAIQYAVQDVLKLFSSIANPEVTLALRAQAAVARAIATSDLASLSRDIIEAETKRAIPGESWGLSDLEVRITTMVNARVLRLIQHEYRSGSGLDDTFSMDDNKRVRS